MGPASGEAGAAASGPVDTADPFNLRHGAGASVAAEPPSSAAEESSGEQETSGAEEQASGANVQTLAAGKAPAGSDEAMDVAVPAGVLPGGTFDARIPDGGEMAVFLSPSLSLSHTHTHSLSFSLSISLSLSLSIPSLNPEP